MPKGYWIANNIVHDAATYESYKAANAAPLAKYGAKFVVRGGTQEGKEGTTFPRTVVIEFASYADALACYDDPGVSGGGQDPPAGVGRYPESSSKATTGSG